MNTKPYLCLCLVVSFFLVGCGGNEPVEATVLRGSLDEYPILLNRLLLVPGTLPNTEDFGIMVGLIDGDNVTIAVAGNESFTEDTLFQYGSITKLMTANVIAQLAVEGVLDIHDPINKHLPASLQSPKWEERTILEVASHIGGVPHTPPGYEYSAEETLAFDREALADAINTTSLQKTGTVAYSNFGYMILGLVIEEVTGLSYAEAVQARIFDPMGMETASIHGWRGDDVAPPLDIKGKPGEVIDFDAGASAGALRGSVTDLLAFLAFSMNACQRDDVVAQGSCLAQDSDLRPDNVTGRRRGLGFDFLDDDTVGHGGAIQGYQAYTAFSTVEDKAIVIVANSLSMVDFEGIGASWVLRDHSEGAD